MNAIKTLMGIVCIASLGASATPSITVDSVIQRWPWNNKVDITYTVTDGQDVSASIFRKIVFTAVVDGQTCVIDGVSDVGASANTGTHTITWTPPFGVKRMDCTMTAALYESDAPSGDDYMIVDLTKTSHNITFEGLLATQSASNSRYNKDASKDRYLVLRKVAAGGLYPTGANGYSSNTPKTWTTDRDYYIGVFPVTQAQYTRLCGSNPSTKKTSTSTNPAAGRPVETVSWIDLRGENRPDKSIPAVTSLTGTFFQRLNYGTGDRFEFDLPTEVMFEIAERAGTTTAYYWGDAIGSAPNYAIWSGNSGGNPVFVGNKLPNGLGLYDTTGNVWEWCRDKAVAGDMTSRTDPFTPASGSFGLTSEVIVRGGCYSDSNQDYFKSAYRKNISCSTKDSTVGFRVATVADWKGSATGTATSEMPSGHPLYTSVPATFNIDTVQEGPNRRSRSTSVLPVAYSGDNWLFGAGSASAVSTLTFVPPYGETTLTNLTGFGTQDFPAVTSGKWTVQLTQGGETVEEAEVSIVGGMVLLFH